VKLKDRCVLITGGAGLVGSHIADLLVQEGVSQIRIIDNFVRGCRENLQIPSSVLDLIDGDVRDRNVVDAAMEGVDLVYHQAALRITHCAEDPRAAVDVMANGTFNVLEAAVAHGVKKVVAASSASVYGMAERFPTSEDHHPYNNRTLYGAAKVFLEGLLRSFNEMYGLDYVAFRYFNVYGPRMDTTGVYTEVLVRWMHRIAEGEPPIIFGDGKQTVDLVYVGDVAQANILAARSDATDQVFNVATGSEVSLLELAQSLLEVMGADMEPQFEAERKVNPVPKRVGDTQMARQSLGFETQVDLKTGLRHLVDWHQRQ
jgi:UDP-glucose 4-epimerase